MVIDFLVLVFFSVALRLLIISGSSSTDDWGHLLRLRNRRNLSHPFDYRAQNTVFPGIDGYPQFYHYIVSRLPEKYWLLGGKSLNVFWDLVLVLVSPAIVVFWLGEGFIGPLSVELVAGLLAATTPALLPLTDRLKAMGSRVIGNILFWIYLGGTYLTLFSNEIVLLLAGFCLSILSVYLIVLTSQFALQVVIWAAIIISIFHVNLAPFAVVALCLALLVMFPALGGREVLVSKYAHWRWYFENFEATPASARNRFDLRGLSLKNLVSPTKEAAGFLLKRWTPLIVFYSLPSVFIFAYFSFLQPDILISLIVDDIGYYLFSVLVSMLLAALITSFRYFAFLGEAERYLEYSVPAASTIFMYAIVGSQIPPKVVYLLVFVQLSIVFILQTTISLTTFVRDNLIADAADKADDTSALISFLKSQQPMRLITVPVKLAHRLGSVGGCSHKFYYRLVRPFGVFSYEYLTNDTVSFELIDPDFKRLAEKYSLDAVVIKKDLLNRAKDRGVDYSQTLSQCGVMYENDSFLVVTPSG